MAIDTTRQIAEMPNITLSGVDSLLVKGLGHVFDTIFGKIYNVFQSGVDLASETLTGQRLYSDLPTDWVKSD
jgi:hypothetical protein